MAAGVLQEWLGEIADPVHAAGGETEATECNAAPVFPAARVNYGKKFFWGGGRRKNLCKS
jgi:hypothetical protein